MRVTIVVKNIQMPRIQEITVGGVTEVNNPTLLPLAASIGDLDTAIAVLAGLHAADSVQGYEAVGQALGLVVPSLAGIRVVGEVGGESVGFGRG